MGGRIHLPMWLPQSFVAQPAQGPSASLVGFGERQGPSDGLAIGQPAGGLSQSLFLASRTHCLVWAPASVLELKLNLIDDYGL
jgi:hypothetical protein